MCRNLQSDGNDANHLLIHAVQHSTGVDVTRPCKPPTRIVSHARAVYCILATEYLHMGQCEIANHIKTSQQAVSLILNRTRMALNTAKPIGWYDPRTISKLIHNTYQTFLRIKPS